MWIFYIVAAVMLSVGVGVDHGAMMSRIASEQAVTLNKPKVASHNITVVSRRLRRLYLADPSQFPDLPQGDKTAKITDKLWRDQLGDGINLPRGTTFTIDAHGRIIGTVVDDLGIINAETIDAEQTKVFGDQLITSAISPNGGTPQAGTSLKSLQ